MNRDRMLYVCAGIIGFAVVNVIAGIIRGPIDDAYMLQVESRSRNGSDPWGVAAPMTVNYFLGSFGRITQIRDSNHHYVIRSYRMLNILPDIKQKPLYIGLVISRR